MFYINKEDKSIHFGTEGGFKMTWLLIIISTLLIIYFD